MVEKAIKHFEALQKRYTKQHNGKMCEYVKIALDAIHKENELVRCKNCIYYHKELGYGFGQCSKCNLMPYPDDFCSYGERREGE